jgi:hypothetical protein
VPSSNFVALISLCSYALVTTQVLGAQVYLIEFNGIDEVERTTWIDQPYWAWYRARLPQPFFSGGCNEHLEGPSCDQEHGGSRLSARSPAHIWILQSFDRLTLPASSDLFHWGYSRDRLDGGAMAAHVRVRDKFFIQAAVPITIWVGFGIRHQSAMHSLLGF